jgi:hypothetical protein
MRGWTALRERQIIHIPMISGPDFSGFAEKNHWLVNAQLYTEKSFALMKRTLSETARCANLPRLVHQDFRGRHSDVARR